MRRGRWKDCLTKWRWWMNNSDEVKCVDCGFLGCRKRPGSEIIEADTWYREQLSPALGLPVCRAGAIDFNSKKEADERWCGRNLKEVLCSSHQCKEFEPYSIGKTPQEHEDMISASKMFEWQQKVESAIETRHRQSQRSQFAIGCLTAVATVLASVIASVFSSRAVEIFWPVHKENPPAQQTEPPKLPEPPQPPATQT